MEMRFDVAAAPPTAEKLELWRQRLAFGARGLFAMILGCLVLLTVGLVAWACTASGLIQGGAGELPLSSWAPSACIVAVAFGLVLGAVAGMGESLAGVPFSVRCVMASGMLQGAALMSMIIGAAGLLSDLSAARAAGGLEQSQAGALAGWHLGVAVVCGLAVAVMHFGARQGRMLAAAQDLYGDLSAEDPAWRDLWSARQDDPQCSTYLQRLLEQGRLPNRGEVSALLARWSQVQQRQQALQGRQDIHAARVALGFGEFS